jgi:hypothetical protein
MSASDESGVRDRERDTSNSPSAAEICVMAVRYVEQMTGRRPDTVSAIEPADDGWAIEVELVELERIPASTSVLATYEVRLDRDGSLRSYRRMRRYYRNAADGE